MREITEEEFTRCLKLTEEYCPRVIPAGWKFTQGPFPGQKTYLRGDGLMVIFTADDMWGDGKIWIHVSMSRRSRIPTYEDMTDVKAIFIGAGRQALQIFPSADKHVNIHPNCLHLWCAVDGDGLPDFGKEGSI